MGGDRAGSRTRWGSCTAISPENLFATRDGRVKILDLAWQGDHRRWRGGRLGVELHAAWGPDRDPAPCWAPLAMSPEQVTGDSVDARSDLFAFGAVLYELLTGRRVRRGTPVERAYAILKDDPHPRPTQVSQGDLPALERSFVAAWRKAEGVSVGARSRVPLAVGIDHFGARRQRVTRDIAAARPRAACRAGRRVDRRRRDAAIPATARTARPPAAGPSRDPRAAAATRPAQPRPAPHIPARHGH
jgi:hypothetical protein